MRRAGIWGVLFCAVIQCQAGPGPTDRHESRLILRAGKLALEHYCARKLNDISGLNAREQYDLFRQSSGAGVAIMLFEFVSGEGPSTRYLDERYAFVQELKQGPAMRYLAYTYLSMSDSEQVSQPMLYRFSPDLRRPSTWKFSITQHHTTLRENNLSQFMLGSFYSEFIGQADGITHVHIYNVTSRKSYFLRIGRRIQRPMLFGNITQRITLSLSEQELFELAAAHRTRGKKNPASGGIR